MLKPSPKVSVIVAIYNMDDYLLKCLDSLSNQTFTNYEVILVDDGSTDGSLQICEDYKAKDERFRVITKENGGVASARQAGLEQSQGEYVIHVDPDDWVELDMLESLVSYAEETKADMVICDYYEYTNAGVVYKKQEPKSLDCQSLIIELFRTLHGSCWNKLVKRAKIVENNVYFPPLSLCEDTYFCVSFLMYPVKVSYFNRAYYYYNRLNVKSVTWKGNPKTGLYAWQACEEFRKLLNGNDVFWQVFVRDEMPWMAYLTLYYGAVSKDEFQSAYHEMKDYISNARNVKLVKLALTHFLLARLVVMVGRRFGVIKRFLVNKNHNVK